MSFRYFALTVVASLSLVVGNSYGNRGGPSGSSPASRSVSLASLVGRVKWEGPLPRPVPINMAADPTCMKQHSQTLMVHPLEVSNGGVANVVVFISNGLAQGDYDPPTQPAIMEQKGCLYEPRVVALRANQPLRIVNQDNVTHNIHPVPANNREWNKAQPPGTTIEESFAREEIAIPVKCNLHPWMRGSIAVFKHPFFAVTREGGRFDLSNVPPGEYTIQAWHEKLGTMSQKITVTAGETKNLDFVFKAGH